MVHSLASLSFLLKRLLERPHLYPCLLYPALFFSCPSGIQHICLASLLEVKLYKGLTVSLIARFLVLSTEWTLKQYLLKEQMAHGYPLKDFFLGLQPSPWSTSISPVLWYSAPNTRPFLVPSAAILLGPYKFELIIDRTHHYRNTPSLLRFSM